MIAPSLTSFFPIVGLLLLSLNVARLCVSGADRPRVAAAITNSLPSNPPYINSGNKVYYVTYMPDNIAATTAEIWLTQDSSLTPIRVQYQPNPLRNLGRNYTILVPYSEAANVGFPYYWDEVNKEITNIPTIDFRVVKLSSESPFAVYVSGKSRLVPGSDSFLAVATQNLGTRYMASCNWNGVNPCTIRISPVMNKTNVTMTLPKNGATINAEEKACFATYRNQTIRNGQSLKLILNEFDVIHFQNECDLTGTLIEADAKISVWSGNAPSVEGDNLIEQLIPLDNWGFDCAAWPTPERDITISDDDDDTFDVWVITASRNGTDVVVNFNENAEKSTFNLDRGESVRLVSSPERDWQYFTANKPVQVVKFSNSAYRAVVNGSSESTKARAASMTTCLSRNNFGQGGFTFDTLVQSCVTCITTLVVLIPDLQRNGLLLGGQLLSPERVIWRRIPSSDLVGGYIRLDSSSAQCYRIEHRNRTTLFIVYVYTDGYRVSVGYPAGASIKPPPLTTTTRTTRSVTSNFRRTSRTVPVTTTSSGLCGELPEIPHGDVTEGESNVGATRLIACDDGYELTGGSEITCLKTGIWGHYGSCTTNGCDEVPEIPHGEVSDGENNVGATRLITCDEGYELRGSSEMTCLKGGTWSRHGNCTVAGCGATPLVPNGKVGNGESDIGSARDVTCNQGFVLVGADQIACNSRRMWTGPGRCSPN